MKRVAEKKERKKEIDGGHLFGSHASVDGIGVTKVVRQGDDVGLVAVLVHRAHKAGLRHGLRHQTSNVVETNKKYRRREEIVSADGAIALNMKTISSFPDKLASTPFGRFKLQQETFNEWKHFLRIPSLATARVSSPNAY